jgi:membrane associated rhomboid family serine protease
VPPTGLSFRTCCRNTEARNASDRAPRAPHPAPRPPRAPLWPLVAALTALALGWVGTPALRGRILGLGAVWSGLLAGRTAPALPGRRLTMVTHGFLHIGPVHLATDALPLLLLGPPALRRSGPARFRVFRVATMAAAALLQGLVAPPGAAVVGASGAVHALAGASAVWFSQDRAGRRWRALPPLAVLALVPAANARFRLWRDGAFAWQLHAAGLLVGAVAVPGLPRRRGDPVRFFFVQISPPEASAAAARAPAPHRQKARPGAPGRARSCRKRGVQNPRPAYLFLNFDTRPPVSISLAEPPIQAGCASGSMSSDIWSPSLPQVLRT